MIETVQLRGNCTQFGGKLTRVDTVSRHDRAHQRVGERFGEARVASARIHGRSPLLSGIAGAGPVASSMAVAIAGAQLAGRRGLVMLEPHEACPQVRVLDVDG